jgi:hypothetical protein
MALPAQLNTPGQGCDDGIGPCAAITCERATQSDANSVACAWRPLAPPRLPERHRRRPSYPRRISHAGHSGVYEVNLRAPACGRL